MSIFYICNCGNVEKHHNFRHPFVQTIKITQNENFNCFELDANQFPTLYSTKCRKEDCKAVQSLHETPTIEHKYIPLEYTYRNIKFVLPLYTKCIKCDIELHKHNIVMTHSFTTKIHIHNKQDSDKVFILHPEDEDKKIIF